MTPDGNNKTSARVLTPALITRIRSQKRQIRQDDSLGSSFRRNLEEALDGRRALHDLRCLIPNDCDTSGKVDFASNDIISWNTTGALRDESLAQLAEHADFCVGSGGSRLLDGNYPYFEAVE